MVCTQARQALPGIERQFGGLRRETFSRTKPRPLMPSPQPGTQGLRPLGTTCDLNCVGHAYTCRAGAQESFTVVSLPCRRLLRPGSYLILASSVVIGVTSAVYTLPPMPRWERSYDTAFGASVCCSVCCPERRTVPSRSMARRVLLRRPPACCPSSSCCTAPMHTCRLVLLITHWSSK